MPPSPSRHDLFKARVDRLNRLLPGLEEGEARAVHRTRVATRRLRELMPVLQVEENNPGKLVRRLRKATRRLGSVRDSDVLLALLEELQATGRHPERVLRRVADAVRLDAQKQHRHRASKSVAAELRHLQRKLDRVSDVLETARVGPPRGQLSWKAVIDARVAKRAAALKTTIRDAGAVYLPERLHSVRIAIKKLRYAVELIVEAGSVRASADLRALKREQELLGRLHDLQVLVERVRRVQAALTPPDLLAWRELDALIGALENSCRRLHARYIRNRPQLVAMCDRLASRAPAAPRARVRRAG